MTTTETFQHGEVHPEKLVTNGELKAHSLLKLFSQLPHLVFILCSTLVMALTAYFGSKYSNSTVLVRSQASVQIALPTKPNGQTYLNRTLLAGLIENPNYSSFLADRMVDFLNHRRSMHPAETFYTQTILAGLQSTLMKAKASELPRLGLTAYLSRATSRYLVGDYVPSLFSFEFLISVHTDGTLQLKVQGVPQHIGGELIDGFLLSLPPLIEKYKQDYLERKKEEIQSQLREYKSVLPKLVDISSMSKVQDDARIDELLNASLDKIAVDRLSKTFDEIYAIESIPNLQISSIGEVKYTVFEDRNEPPPFLTVSSGAALGFILALAIITFKDMKRTTGE
jgi:hypothetical protein